MFAKPGQLAGRPIGSRPELWVMLYEKAYAQAFGGFHVIGRGGNMGYALEELTGQKSTFLPPAETRFEDFAKHVENGEAVVVGTYPNHMDAAKHSLFMSDTLATGHAYWVESVNLRDKTVTIRDPMGKDYPPVTLTWEQAQKVFDLIAANPADGVER